MQRHLELLGDADLGLAARCRRSLARVRLLAASNRVGEALAECGRAVDEFGALAAALGGTELRAHIALHVTELVDLGLELVVGEGELGGCTGVVRATARSGARRGTGPSAG